MCKEVLLAQLDELQHELPPLYVAGQNGHSGHSGHSGKVYSDTDPGSLNQVFSDLSKMSFLCSVLTS